MSVPFIDLKRFEPGFLGTWNEKVVKMTLNAQFIGGAAVDSLESRLRDICGVSEVVSCANGTDALQLALRALGVGRGDKVLVPDLTFWATFEAVVNVGADPYTVDCNLDDQSIDVDIVARLLGTVRPKAVIAVHLYGWGSARLKELRKICREAGVALVEDAAQAYGVALDGRPILEGAQVATTSFYPAKVLGAAGDGGAVFCQDSELAAKIRCMANHGRTAHYGHGEVGWNSRMDSLQAAYVALCLDYIDQRLASRREIAASYRESLSRFAPRLRVVGAPVGYTENGYCNVCFVDDLQDKKRFEAALKERGIGFGNIYPSPISAQPGAKQYLAGRAGGENAEWLCSHVLNLPLFPYMTELEFDEIVDVVENTFSS